MAEQYWSTSINKLDGGFLLVSNANSALQHVHSMVVVESNTSAVTITLAPQEGSQAQFVDIVADNGATNAVTISPAVGDTIDRTAGKTILLDGSPSRVRLRGDGGTWWTVGYDGGFTQLATITVSTPIAAWEGDRFVLATNAGAATITLPSAAAVPAGSKITIVKTAGAGVATVAPQAGEPINGVAAGTAMAANEAYQLISLGSAANGWALLVGII